MQRKRSLMPLVTFLMFLSLGLYLTRLNTTVVKYNQSQFEKTIAETSENKFKDITIIPKDKLIKVTGKIIQDGKWVDFATTYPNTEANYNKLVTQLNKKVDSAASGVVIEEPNDRNWTGILIQALIFLLPALLIIRFLSKNGPNKGIEFGKSKAKLQQGEESTFADVAGAKEEKEELAELVDFLKQKGKYVEAGARVPKGVLLVGPPGTGKTLLAKAVAGEAKVPFYSISGSDFVEMFVGVGASRVRSMFKEAKKNSPCIIFIDEIDAVGRHRGSGMGGGHDEREQTLNQLLVEMDGFAKNSGIIIIAATNREDVLDPALLRPGRFDRKITVHLPDVIAREEILKVHSKNKKISTEVNFNFIARRTPGFSGADLENTLNEAALLSVRDKTSKISAKHIDEAIDRVIGGPAKLSKKRNEKAQRLVAYHEAGHAIIGLKLADAEIVQKVTIIPRGAAGGYVLMTPKEESFIQTKQQLKHKIASYLGGRISEEIHFGKDHITTGASDDLKKATAIARRMVTEFGMSEKVGPLQIESSAGPVFVGMQPQHSENKFGGEVGKLIDQEINALIREGEKAAHKIISKHKDKVKEIAEALLKYETLTAEMIENIDKHGDPFYKAPAKEIVGTPTSKPASKKEVEKKFDKEKQQTLDL